MESMLEEFVCLCRSEATLLQANEDVNTLKHCITKIIFQLTIL